MNKGEKIDLFIRDYKKYFSNEDNGEEWYSSHADNLSELGTLCNEYDITSDDLKDIKKSGKLQDDFNYLNILIEDSLELENKDENDLIKVLRTKKISICFNDGSNDFYRAPFIFNKDGTYTSKKYQYENLPEKTLVNWILDKKATLYLEYEIK